MLVTSKHCIVGRILYCLVIYLARNVSNVFLQINNFKKLEKLNLRLHARVRPPEKRENRASLASSHTATRITSVILSRLQINLSIISRQV